jgi:hypothetical protein
MINVRDFGAVGDGATDDRQAIQDALNVGGWVYVPPGVYALASGVPRIYGRTRLTLDPKATILRDGAAAMLYNGDPEQDLGGYTGHGQILVEGGTWDVNATGPNAAMAVGLGFGHCEDITVRDATFLNVPDTHALEINAARSVLVDNCKFRGFVNVSGNRSGSEAIQVDAAVSAGTFYGFGPYDGTVCDGVEVRSCRFGGSGTVGTQAWPRGVGSHTAPTARHRNIKVLACTFDEVTETAIRAFWWDSAIFAHNQIQGCDGDGITVQHTSRYVEVVDNQIFDAGRNGILVSNECTQINVRENDVIGAGRNANNTYGGIRASDSSNLRFTNNTVRRRASGNSARHGLWIDGGCASVQRHGNDLRSSGVTSSLYDASGSSVTAATDVV